MISAYGALGSTLSDRLRLRVFYLRYVLSVTTPLPRPRPAHVRVRGLARPVVIGDGGELAVLRDVLIEREYATESEPRVILDIGANAGFATLYFKSRYPAARVIAVEADWRAYKRLLENVQGLDGVSTYHAAIGTQDGTTSFFCSTDSSICSSLTRRSDADEEVSVETLTLDTLLERAAVDRVDLLKLDVEGAEADVLPTAPLERINEIIAELHYAHPAVSADTLRRALEPHFTVEIQELPASDFGLLHATRRA
jgi:FkbM family methyltransferase